MFCRYCSYVNNNRFHTCTGRRGYLFFSRIYRYAKSMLLAILLFFISVSGCTSTTKSFLV
uniref:Uncharacterized protein n=1 Tax=Arundo donax TaxID=35708 RepID=A0A0A9FSC6_ARUDO